MHKIVSSYILVFKCTSKKSKDQLQKITTFMWFRSSPQPKTLANSPVWSVPVKWVVNTSPFVTRAHHSGCRSSYAIICGWGGWQKKNTKITCWSNIEINVVAAMTSSSQFHPRGSVALVSDVWRLVVNTGITSYNGSATVNLFYFYFFPKN